MSSIINVFNEIPDAMETMEELLPTRAPTKTEIMRFILAHPDAAPSDTDVIKFLLAEASANN